MLPHFVTTALARETGYRGFPRNRITAGFGIGVPILLDDREAVSRRLDGAGGVCSVDFGACHIHKLDAAVFGAAFFGGVCRHGCGEADTGREKPFPRNAFGSEEIHNGFRSALGELAVVFK